MTIISRRKYDHPALATAGGSGLHASIENLYTVLGNDSMSRYAAFSAINNSTVAVVAHEFGLDFANLKVQIFTGTYPALTLVSDPIGSGWTVAATTGLASRSIDVTTPASGGPHTYAVLVSHESNATAFIPGLVSIGAQSFAGPKTFLSPILSSLGSVSLPGYSFTGDPNTGMWSSAADTLSFSAGGVKGLEISSIGANNFGPTTGLGTTGSAYHSIYGSIVGAYATGANRFLVVNDTGVVISANQYRDGAGTVKSVSTLTGITTLAILRQSSGTSNVFNLQANYLDAQTANSTSLETNTFSILSVTAAGTCTLGPAAGSVGHIINGQDGNPASFSGSVNINAQSTAANQMSLRLGTYTTGDYSWIQSLQTTTGNPKPLRFYSATVVAGSYDTAGAWTLGPASSTATNVIVNGSLNMLTSGAAWTASAAFPYIGSKAAASIFRTNGTHYVTGAAYFDGAWKTAIASNSGASISVNATTASSQTAITFAAQSTYSGSADASISMDAIGSVTAAGAWTFGPASVSNTHIFNGRYLRLKSYGTTDETLLILSTSDFSKNSAIGQENSLGNQVITGSQAYGLSIQSESGLNFSGGGSTLHGKVTTAGAWTLGPSSGLTAQHIIRSASGSGQLDLQGTAAASRLGLTITNSASSIKGYIVVAGSSNDLITGDVLNDLNISFTGSNLNFGATTALVGKVTSAGAWTLGPATGDNLTTTHIVKSGDASSGGAGSRSVTILRADCVAGSPSTAALVVGNTTSQAGIIHERGSQNHIWTRDTLNFTYTSSATIQNPISGMTGYLNLGSVSTAGAWTLGSLTDTGGLTVNASGGQPLTLASASSTNRITLKYSSTTIGGYMGVSATGLDFLNSTSDYTFRVSDAGACTLGPDSGYTIVHKSFGTWDHKTAASVGVGAIYRSAAALTSGQSHEAVQIYDNTTYKGGFGVAKTTNTSNQAGFLALVTNDGTVCYLWCDDTGRLRISTTQANTGGQATGTVVGTQT